MLSTTLTSARSFSALQRAENSSMSLLKSGGWLARDGFSALQRAENSSILPSRWALTRPARSAFQCSSASRKFLNQERVIVNHHCLLHVSVLFSEPKIPQYRIERRLTSSAATFQCSSASRKFLNNAGLRERSPACAEFQCSSASRKFLNLERAPRTPALSVWFQCSSASRKFLNRNRVGVSVAGVRFQCSSASRKFLNCKGK